jgi:hypothetical protein
MNKILVVMQYWAGDVESAEQTLSLISDLGPYKNADILLSQRFDAPDISKKVQRELGDSFPQVLSFVGKRRSVGHPAAPNAMWHETVQHVGLLQRDKRMDYDCVLTLEADAIPVTVDWLDQLHAEWKAKQPAQVVGCWSPTTNPRLPEGTGHINGNMLVNPLLTIITPSLAMTPPHEAWDTWHAGTFKKAGWAPTPLITNRYRETALTSWDIQKMVTCGAVLVHGVKDSSVLQWSRKKLFTK